MLCSFMFSEYFILCVLFVTVVCNSSQYAAVPRHMSSTACRVLFSNYIYVLHRFLIHRRMMSGSINRLSASLGTLASQGGRELILRL